jgi:hypothetical protein
VVTPYLPDPALQTAGARRAGRELPTAGITLALLSFWLGLIWVATVPPMNAPDEPAYLQAIMETRNKRMIPEIHFDFGKNPADDLVGDPGDPAARAYAAQHNMDRGIRLMPYQNSQPPLYFIIAGPAAMLLPSDPQIITYAGRLISTLFGAGTVFFCWAAARELAPRCPMWAVATAGVIALLPEFCFNNARVGNDSLVNCLAAAAYYVWFRGLRRPDYDPWMLRAGAVVGLAVLAKLTAVALIPGLALVVLFRAFQPEYRVSRPSSWITEYRVESTGATMLRTQHSLLGTRYSVLFLRGARMAAGAGSAALLVCGWWLVRNLNVYGDLTGTAAVNKFYNITLQPPGFSLATPAQQSAFIESTWKSFWGFFGWQTIPLPAPFYSQAGLFTLVLFGLTGLAALWFIVRRFQMRNAQRRTIPHSEFPIPHSIVPTYAWQAIAVLAAVGIALLVAFVQYSLQVAEAAQGRYLYLLLLPASLLFTGGLYALPPRRALKIIALSLPMLWLGAMNFVGLGLVQ